MVLWQVVRQVSSLAFDQQPQRNTHFVRNRMFRTLNQLSRSGIRPLAVQENRPPGRRRKSAGSGIKSGSGSVRDDPDVDEAFAPFVAQATAPPGGR